MVGTAARSGRRKRLNTTQAKPDPGAVVCAETDALVAVLVKLDSAAQERAEMNPSKGG